MPDLETLQNAGLREYIVEMHKKHEAELLFRDAKIIELRAELESTQRELRLLMGDQDV